MKKTIGQKKTEITELALEALSLLLEEKEPYSGYLVEGYFIRGKK